VLLFKSQPFRLFSVMMALCNLNHW